MWLRVLVMLALAHTQPGTLAAQDLPDTLTVAVLESWPPHYATGPDGEATGFAVAVMDAVSRRIGIPLRYRSFPSFWAATTALGNGTVDVIPDYGITQDRMRDVAFTRPFEAFRVSIFIRETDPTITTGDDLAGRTVATTLTNVAMDLIPLRYPTARVVGYENPAEALFELLAADVDAVAYPEEVFLALARSAGVSDRIRTIPPALVEIPRGMAVRRADTLLLAELNRAVNDLVASTEYGEIYREWFAPPRSQWTVTRVLWIAGIALLLVLVGMAIWRYVSVVRLAADLARTLAERDAARLHGRREEERFRTLVNTAYEGIVMGDGENRIVFANRRLLEMLGLSESEVIGRTLFDFVDEEYHERLWAGLERRQKGLSDSYEIALCTADGSRIPVLVSVAPLKTDDGAFEGSVATMADLTGRVEAEAALLEREHRFRAFVENASELISTLSPDGIMDYQSPPLTRLLGYTGEELRGRSAFDFLHPDDVEDTRAAWGEMLRKPGAPVASGPFRFRHRDGSWRTLAANFTNLLDEPAVRAVLSNAHDITIRSDLERQLLQSQKLEAIGRLAGGIAHDFNNLLTVMRAQTDLMLLDLAPDHPLEPEVRVLQDASDRAATLTGQLLAFSRDQVLRPRLVSLCQVTRDTAGLLARIIGDDVSLRLDIPGDLPAVRLDPGHLEQVILNLGVNARDAMPGGGTLTLSTRAETLDETGAAAVGDIEPGSYVVLEVSDTGTGMDPETLEHLFEPFFTTKEPGRGTGLGLAIVYGFVKQTGGSIQIRNELGAGATFLLRFPAAEGAPEEARPVASRAVLPVHEWHHTILLVEDSDAVRRVGRRILERAGFAVTEAADAETALEILKDRDDIDVVLTDLGLPGMSGRSLVERIRSARPGLQCIVTSGYAEESSEKPRDLPPDLPFLPKPFTIHTLVEAVRNVLRDSSSHDQEAGS